MSDLKLRPFASNGDPATVSTKVLRGCIPDCPQTTPQAASVLAAIVQSMEVYSALPRTAARTWMFSFYLQVRMMRFWLFDSTK